MEALGMLEFRGSENWIAALLALGIYEDPIKLSDISNEDSEAYNKICKFIKNFQDLKRLIRFPKSRAEFKNRAHALNTMEENGSRILSSVGVIASDRGDDISTIADELIEMEGVSLVVVYGILSDTKRVRLSARSTDTSQPIDEFLRQRFGGRVGGKINDNGSGIGGGLMELDLGFWYCSYTWEEVYHLVQKRLRASLAVASLILPSFLT
jgi:nanoRNase/pAp phosphatase (c-di-AMP/oligoRNAs hydrolase)